MTVPSQPLFLFGPGYTGHALAEIWQGPVFGSVRSGAAMERLSETIIAPVQLDDRVALLAAITNAHVLISAPPDDRCCPAERLIGAFVNAAASVTYLSTTGVYGDRGGGWVFEWSRVNPGSERGQRRVRAEQEWLKIRRDVRIVRLPGIYGPGRSVFDRLRNGKAHRIIKPGQVFSRIHVADLAYGLKQLLPSHHDGVFHFCDEEAAPPQDVTAYAAQLSGRPCPPDQTFDAAKLSAMAASFYLECKRVSNARAKAALGWQPQYPTYREGLSAILKAES